MISCLALAWPLAAHKKAELAPTPPMGWNSWNWWGKLDINEQLIRDTIDAMVEHGLRDAGYDYVVIDGGWRDTKLSPIGELLPHPERFPNGIKPLADYAHERGMKLGVHIVPGTHDCGGDLVGGLGKEELHVQQMVDWGVDIIKLDQCINRSKTDCGGCERMKSGWSVQAIEDSYRKWSRLLAEADRDILFSISAYEFREWWPEVCNMARTTGDIQARCTVGGAMFNPLESIQKPFFSVIEIALENNEAAHAAGNGYWNDPDMMVTGEQGMTDHEQESHFALWCVMSSPLFLGNDPLSMRDFERELITNEELIAINQDPNEQGRLVADSEGSQVWAKTLSNGDTAIALLNLDRKNEREVRFDLSKIGLDGTYKTRDALKQRRGKRVNGAISAELETNQCKVFVLYR